MSESQPAAVLSDAFASAIDIPAASELVASRLRQAIHLGEIAAGSKFPPERELSRQMNVSRETLRAALHMLRDEHYVDIRHGKYGGVYVRPQVLLHDQFLELSPAQRSELSDIFELRAVVEGFAAARASRSVSADALETLDATVVAMRETDSISEFRRNDLIFHMTIAEATGSTLICNIVSQLRAALYPPFQLFDLEQMKSNSVNAHSLVLDALRNGDARAAQRIMTKHIREIAVGAAKIGNNIAE